jgi:hypothetical protein
MENYLGFSKYQYRILSAYMDAACNMLPKYYKTDCCIASSKIAIEILSKFHFKVRPLTVQITVLNPIIGSILQEEGKLPDDEEVARRGGWIMIVGSRQESQPKKWPGHLIPIVEEKAIIDVSLVQANRPHKKINLHPLLIQIAEPGFLKGTKTECLMIKGCHLEYRAFPDDKTYVTAKDWYDLKKHKEAISAIWISMRNILKK